MSLTYKLDTTGLNNLIANLDGDADRAINAIAFQVEGRAKSFAPVDTGALKNSIQVSKQGNALYWVTDAVEYGIWQEIGTSRMPARPFMVPAVEATAADVAQIVAQEVFDE